MIPRAEIERLASVGYEAFRGRYDETIGHPTFPRWALADGIEKDSWVSAIEAVLAELRPQGGHVLPAKPLVPPWEAPWEPIDGEAHPCAAMAPQGDVRMSVRPSGRLDEPEPSEGNLAQTIGGSVLTHGGSDGT